MPTRYKISIKIFDYIPKMSKILRKFLKSVKKKVRSQKWSDLLILACKVSFLYNEGLHVRIWGYIDRFLSDFFFDGLSKPN